MLPCQQLRVIHITKCSRLMIPGSRSPCGFSSHFEAGHRNICHLPVPPGPLTWFLSHFRGQADWIFSASFTGEKAETQYY